MEIIGKRQHDFRARRLVLSHRGFDENIIRVGYGVLSQNQFVVSGIAHQGRIQFRVVEVDFNLIQSLAQHPARTRDGLRDDGRNLRAEIQFEVKRYGGVGRRRGVKALPQCVLQRWSDIDRVPDRRLMFPRIAAPPYCPAARRHD